MDCVQPHVGQRLLDAVQCNNETVVAELLQRGVSANFGSIQKFKTPLMVAVRNCNHAIVLLLLQHGADVDVLSFHGETALYYASCCGYYDIVLTLLEHGAKPDAPSANGRTPLMSSSTVSRLPTVELLIAKGADVNAKDRYGRTPLVFAAKVNRFDIVRMFLTHGADVNIVYGIDAGPDRLTLLCQLGRCHRYRMMDYLVKNGADVDARHKDGTTGLILASKMMDKPLVEAYLRNGPDLEMTDNTGNTALLVAAEHSVLLYPQDHTGVHDRVEGVCADMDFMYRYSVWETLFARLNEANDPAFVKAFTLWYRRLSSPTIPKDVLPLLVEHGVNANAQRQDGSTALILLSKKGDVDNVRFLLSNGADAEL